MNGTSPASATRPGRMNGSPVSISTNFQFCTILSQWQDAVNQEYYTNCPNSPIVANQVHGHFGKLYARLDIGSSGAFMVELSTGIVYGIKRYGSVDKKKISGNINDPAFSGAVLVQTRYKYGRFDLRKPEDRQDILATAPAVRS